MDHWLTGMTPTVGVIPIFVSGGAALLPAIVAGVVSAAALLLRPRELVAACRRRPYVPAAVLLAGVGIWFGVAHFNARPAEGGGRLRAGSGAAAAAGSATDWRSVALAILAADHDGAAHGPALTPSGSTVTNRPVFLGLDASRCGYDGGSAPVELRAVARYADATDLHRAMVLCSPAVAGGMVFGGTCVLDPPSNYGTLFALDADTFQPRWVVDVVTDPKTGREVDIKGIFSSPAVSADGKRVVFGEGLHPDSNCGLMCLDTATGRLLWRVPTTQHIESSPVIDGDTVVVGCGAIEDPNDSTKVKGHHGYVLAVHLQTGEELWRYDVRDPESSPAIADGVVYIGSGFNGRAIVALRLGTDAELKAQGVERLLWCCEAPYPVTGAITIADDLVLAGGGNGDYVFSAPNPAGVVLAVDRRDGAIRWQTEVGDSVLGFVAYRDGVAIATSRTGEVLALDIKDGRILWRQSIGSGTPVLTGPAFTGRYVYAASKGGYLVVLDAGKNGEIVKKGYLNDTAHPGEQGLTLSSPTVIGGRVYIGSETGGLRGFE
jgi:outer membrane protein assembly factor BamB